MLVLYMAIYAIFFHHSIFHDSCWISLAWTRKAQTMKHDRENISLNANWISTTFYYWHNCFIYWKMALLLSIKSQSACKCSKLFIYCESLTIIVTIIIVTFIVSFLQLVLFDCYHDNKCVAWWYLFKIYTTVVSIGSYCHLF